VISGGVGTERGRHLAERVRAGLRGQAAHRYGGEGRGGDHNTGENAANEQRRGIRE
jgi:hypothetical protein